MNGKFFQRISLNTLWQLMPAISTLAISALVVHQYLTETWGLIVQLLIPQQIFNAILTWGDTDYLQRSYSNETSKFKQNYSSFVVTRIPFALLFALILWIISPELKWTLSLLLLARFATQSMRILVVIEKRFKTMFLLDLVLLIPILLSVKFIPNYQAVLWSLLGTAILVVVVQIFLFRAYFVRAQWSFKHIWQSRHLGVVNVIGLLMSRFDLYLINQFYSLDLLAKYQILMSFVWNGQALARHYFTPIQHHFFRMKRLQKIQVVRKSRWMGFWVASSVSILVFVAMNLLFEIDIEWFGMGFTFICVFISFYQFHWFLATLELNAEVAFMIASIVSIFIMVLSYWLSSKVFGNEFIPLLYGVLTFQVLSLIPRYLAYRWASVR